MSWRFAIRPRWLVGHVLIVGLSVLFVSLAVWQYDRMHERQALNRELRQQLEMPAKFVATIDEAADVPEYQKVTLTGQWDYSHPVYVRYAVQNGASGYYVLMPFVVDDGAYLVNAGFIVRGEGDSASIPDAGLSDVLAIEGWMRDPQRTDKPVGQTSGDPPVPTVATVDLDKLGPLVEPYRLAAKWVQLTEPEPQGTIELASPPDLSDGPHQGYMLQWIAFTVLAIVGWCAVLWRTANDQTS